MVDFNSETAFANFIRTLALKYPVKSLYTHWIDSLDKGNPEMSKAIWKATKLRQVIDIKSQLGKKGSTLIPGLQVPLAGVQGYDLGNAGMNYAAQNMGIPQTMDMMDNTNQDTLNMQRRQAILRAQQGGR